MRLLRLLLAKEFRELSASRAYWLLLLMIGLLVGHSFITAVDLYAEASGRGGGPAALAQGLSPLDGMLVPTFGAYDLAVTLLFPFVAIRLISAEKESGALKLMLQAPAGLAAQLLAKGLTLIAGWAVAWIPGLLALTLWKIYGGSLYAPEVLNLLLGHLLRVILASGVAVAAAAIAKSAASAAIVTLGFTVGTWALDFVAAGRGGLLQKLAAYTPTAALRTFEQGQLRLSTAIILIVLGVAGFVIAGVWLPTRRNLRSRLLGSVAVFLTASCALWAGSMLRASWDVSENRRNSFPVAAEAALRQIHQPLRVTVFLAAEDPRLMDLDRGILSKLQRILPEVDIEYAAHSRAGLFENGTDHYGEVWYEIDGRKVMSRSTTEPIVLDTLYKLAQIPPPANSGGNEYPGHPLPANPTGAAWIFYALWPLAVGLLWWRRFRYSS
ncbi:MAG TPA: ABC transporter permease subunit [Bryobacteraceae bacterium]|nr:ABC transporter permease subunit [Bryobacteraceae bacterium]